MGLLAKYSGIHVGVWSGIWTTKLNVYAETHVFKKNKQDKNACAFCLYNE